MDQFELYEEDADMIKKGLTSQDVGPFFRVHFRVHKGCFLLIFRVNF